MVVVSFVTLTIVVSHFCVISDTNDIVYHLQARIEELEEELEAERAARSKVSFPILLGNDLLRIEKNCFMNISQFDIV